MTVADGDVVQPGNMYTMKPINKLDEKIDLPTSMYKLPNLHPSSNTQTQTTTSTTNQVDTSKMTPEMKTLYEKQTNILSSLDSLKNEMQVISTNLGHTFGEKASHSKGKINSSDNVVKLSGRSDNIQPVDLPEGVLDYVISVSSQHLSLSPLLFAYIMQARGIDVSVLTQLHSSLQEIPSKDTLNGYGGIKGRIQVKPTKVNFTFIFKKDPFCPSLMFSPAAQTRIIGDVNIARYLARTFLPDLYEASSSNVSSIDRWLENAQKISNGNRKEKEAAMKALNASLGQQSHVASEDLTLADVVTFAAILSQKNYFKKLPSNVFEWFGRAPSPFLEIMKKFGAPVTWLQ